MKTVDAAKGRWRQILREFGFPEKALDGKHHPCPCDGKGKDRFRFSDQAGWGNYFCNCSPDGRKCGVDLLRCMNGKSFADVASDIDQFLGNRADIEKPDKKDPLPLLKSIDARSTPAGNAVKSYLEGRGLITPKSIREVPDFEYWDDGNLVGRYHAMAVKIVDAENKPQSWHVTYLKDGKKAHVPTARKVMPPLKSITGCAVRLFPQEPILGIAEGVETAIAAHILFQLPVWSCISRHGLESFIPPAGVTKVYVFGDNDPTFAGQSGAYKAAENLHRRGLACDVLIPRLAGDWNDHLLAEVG